MWFKRRHKSSKEATNRKISATKINEAIDLKETLVYNYCEQCDEVTICFVDYKQLEEVFIIKCAKCGYETSYAWCETCECAGEYIKNINSRSEYWTCQQCGHTYRVDESIYDNPIEMYPQSFITKTIKAKIKEKG